MQIILVNFFFFPFTLASLTVPCASSSSFTNEELQQPTVQFTYAAYVGASYSYH